MHFRHCTPGTRRFRTTALGACACGARKHRFPKPFYNDYERLGVHQSPTRCNVCIELVDTLISGTAKPRTTREPQEALIRKQSVRERYCRTYQLHQTLGTPLEAPPSICALQRSYCPAHAVTSEETMEATEHTFALYMQSLHYLIQRYFHRTTSYMNPCLSNLPKPNPSQQARYSASASLNSHMHHRGTIGTLKRERRLAILRILHASMG